MLLSELIKGLKYRKMINFNDTEIKSIEYDSRKIKPGSVFVAISGENYDGHNFVPDAHKKGAVMFVTQKIVDLKLPQIIVKDTRIALTQLAQRFYKDTEEINKIGITGTNGKTTSAFLTHSILLAAGRNPGLIGTIYYLCDNERIKAERTTPESLDLFRLIDKFKKMGARDVVMEVSSHALVLQRVAGFEFQVAVFTNLSQDHLDFHRTIEDYKRAKLRIFSLLKKDGFAVVNMDDRVYPEIEAMKLKNLLKFGTKEGADVTGKIINTSLNGLKVSINYNGENYIINSNLVGDFQIYNILSSFAIGVALEIPISIIVKGIENLKGVRGRLERIGDGIFIDYAHTPQALENVLLALKRFPHRRLIVIFGCGGDRDKDKRPKMGKIASEIADYVIITTDNPRSEDPERIIRDIEKGITGDNYKIIEDRKEAIEYGVGIREKGDILLIAGKGHEEYQILKDRKIPFDDALIVREFLKENIDV